MRRVVVTGMGIVSSIGNNTQEVLASLREAQVRHRPGRRLRRARLPLPGPRRARRSTPEELVDRRAMRFHGGGTAWNHVAMDQAIRDAGLEAGDISNERTGIIMGSGGPSTRAIVEAADIARDEGPEARRPLRGAQGDVVDGLGDARDLVQDQGRELFDLVGLRDLEPLHRQRRRDDPGRQAGHHLRGRLRGARLDAVGAVRRHGRDVVEVQRHARPRPRAPTTRTATASSSPAAPGVLVLEELEHAKARGATIYGEIAGYGATSDGYDMVAPSGEGAVRCMRQAIDGAERRRIDYINPHATSTPVGDVKEIEAIREVFGTGDTCPPISATKSLTGHSLGATGVQEAIYSLLMMRQRLHLRERPYRGDRPGLRRHADRSPAHRDEVSLGHVLSNSFGFGGTNATLVLKHIDA